MEHLPIFLHLAGASVLVVGGGRVAHRKIDLLLKCRAAVTVVAPELCEELRDYCARDRIRHLAQTFQPQHLDGARIAIAATNLKIVNTAVSDAARARSIPVNVVDDPVLSTFIFPALIDRAPVIVAVSSAGNAPVLTRRVREQIEAMLPGTLGELAKFIGARRKAVQLALRPLARRPFWERIVRGAVGARVLRGEQSAAQEDFERELRASQLTASAATGARTLGEVYLIGAGPGDPDLLTLRALQLLQQADVVLYDRLVPAAVLERCRREARRVFVGKGSPPKTAQGPHTDQERIDELMVRFAQEGLRVARLKGGDPFVFGRGGEEIEVLARHGIPYVVVPGITAALGAGAAAGIPLTHRHKAQSLTLVTGHALEDAALDWQALSRPRQTVVFYMGVGHLEHIVARLRAAGAPPTLPAALIERATLPGQRTLRATLEHIAALGREARIAPPALLVLGEVTTLNLETSIEAGTSAEPALPHASV